jgi:hypothetical protein
LCSYLKKKKKKEKKEKEKVNSILEPWYGIKLLIETLTYPKINK